MAELTLSTLEDLERRYEVDVSEENLTLTTALGVTFRIKGTADGDMLLQLGKRVKKAADAIKKNPHPSLQPYLPVSDEMLHLCLYLEALVEDPKLTLADCLRLSRTCGMLIPEMANMTLERLNLVAGSVESSETEELKNDSGETPSEGIG